MRIGIIGATSFVGQCLLPLLEDHINYDDIVAFSRKQQFRRSNSETSSIKWQLLPKSDDFQNRICPVKEQISKWICLAPIWVLHGHFSMLSFYGAKHVVALSSTSRFTKNSSSDPQERALSQKLARGEDEFIAWANNKDIGWTILRTTMIYGLGKDKNISMILRFIRCFSFFFLLGNGKGLRQPIHVCDVAASCLSVLNDRNTTNHSYNLSGNEIITYREMIRRIFSALNKSPRFMKLSPWYFRLILYFLQLSPRFKDWSFAMVERMNQDLVFDHNDAKRDFNFSPRPFIINREDMPA